MRENTGRHQAHLCSSRSPDPERSRSGDLDLQAWRANDGEGQALALREGAAFFFTVARGPVPRDVERFRKHPQLNKWRMFHNAVSVEDGRIPAGIGPTDVVRELSVV